uniref:Prolylcarboxypeptidase n=1 Tax=Lutzomyia longipalpis TaxID=7200 RepID=A0A1B0CT00_LUTLO
MVKKFIQAILAIGALAACVQCEIEMRNFTQPLDHFDENCTETWDNTYYIDESFYQPGGPIFLYVGDMQFYFTDYRIRSSHFRDIAIEAGALLVATEHRYYGNSRPVPDLTADNLVYLTSSQAIEDMAALVRFIRSSSPDLEEAKVIAAGVGHGGALATWLRQAYPDLIHAAWASSAKLNAILNFGEFHTTTTQSVRIYGGVLCYDRMANAFAMLEEVFQNENYTKLVEVFKMCPAEEEFDEEVAGALFFGTLATMIGQIISMMHSPAITSFCGYLERGENDMMGLADWIYYYVYNEQGCLPANMYDLLSEYMGTSWEDQGVIIGGRQQVWQSCNEFGWFKSSNASDHPFGDRFPYERFYEQCNFLLNYTITHEELLASVDNTNALFGGLSPNVTRVYFTNGNIDSEKTLSVLEDLNDQAPADVIPYFGTGADFESMNTTVFQGLRAVQERVRTLLLEWLEIDDEHTEAPTEGTTTTTEATTTTIGITPKVFSHKWKVFQNLHGPPPPPTAKSNPRVVREGWIEQQLDNFDDYNNATYQMRYLANDEFYQSGGPIFIFVGGEWEIAPDFIIGGHMYDMAKEMNGYMFYTEHRFYGQSRPTPDTSFENLQYLHINQALADLAHFIRTMKQEIPGASSSGVILVGASYSATMVTWFRQRYPELVNGAWSSSAPLLAQADFSEYFVIAGQSIRIVGGDTCYNALEEAFKEMQRLIDVEEFDILSEKMYLCSPLANNQDDISVFFKSLAGLMAPVVQYHTPGVIEGACNLILNAETPIDGYGDLVRLLFGECWYADNQGFIAQYKDPAWTTDITRPFVYQQCNEYGWFQTTNAPDQPFGSNIPLDFQLQWCHEIFDESFYNESIKYNVYVTNLNNNGLNPVITNVYSTHGQLDPWRPMGVQTNVNSFAPVVVIPGASHCMDLYSISPTDTPEMIASKQRTTSLCKTWGSFYKEIYRGPPPPSPKSNPRIVREGWIEQLVDNFDEYNNATYQMRYLANDEFYQPGGPIFIFVGGEWEIDPGFVTGGHMYDMGKEMNGYLFYTEHRFYGQSRPSPDTSYEYLQYLHINQALADLAHFIRTMKQEIPGASSSGVILVGGSYSATMVTWFRQKYPELVNGAWSSSAPLLAQADFVEYFETIGQSIRTVGGDACYNAIEGAFREMERLVEDEDFETLAEKTNMCSTLENNPDNIAVFFGTAAIFIAPLVQYHRPGDIEWACATIMGQESNIEGYGEFIRQTIGVCWDADYDEAIQYYANTEWSPDISRQWLYQTCNEFGWFQTSGSPDQPFGSMFPVEMNFQICHDVFGDSYYNESINYNIYITNLNNNGLNPVITNVYSTHGQLDPWRPMGIQENVNSFAPVVVIPGASHCMDLYSISPDDSPEMIASKQRTTALVRQFWRICTENLHRLHLKVTQGPLGEEWIEQQLDNFDEYNNATFQMRYLANDEFYQPGGPLFIYVGGEWSVSPGWILGGHMFDMAREMNGYMFYTEHRYYGQTRPTEDLSFANLQYLHVNQALADLAHFIRTMKQEIPGASSSGVILVGASYSATMVTWFRQRYPELVNGAWSSSAPLYAKADFVDTLKLLANQ